MNLNQLLALQTPRWETSRPVFQRIHQPKLSYLSQARKVDYGPVRVAAEGEPLRLARSAPVLTWLERVALWIALLVAAASGIGLACGAGYVKGARVERKAAAQLRFAEEQHVAAVQRAQLALVASEALKARELLSAHVRVLLADTPRLAGLRH